MNIIEVPSNHEMFSKEFYGELDNFIYDEFGIAFTNEDKMDIAVYVFYKKGIWGTQIHLQSLNDISIEKEIYYDIQPSSDNKGMNVFCNISDSEFLEIGHDLVNLVLRVLCYIMSTPRERIVKKKEFPKPKTDNQKKPTRKNESKIFLLDEIVEYVNENEINRTNHTGNVIKCPCWSVRGHFRHYKSGKVIFIKNYKKGKERENIEPNQKTYAI